MGECDSGRLISSLGPVPRLIRFLVPVIACATIVGCGSSSSDGSSDSPTGSEVTTPATIADATTPSIDVSAPVVTVDNSVDGSAPETSLSIDEIKDLSAEQIADLFIANAPADMDPAKVSCARDEVVKLIKDVGVEAFVDGADTGTATDPVPMALDEIGKRCGLQ